MKIVLSGWEWAIKNVGQYFLSAFRGSGLPMPQDNRVKPTYRYAGVTLYSLRLLKLSRFQKARIKANAFYVVFPGAGVQCPGAAQGPEKGKSRNFLWLDHRQLDIGNYMLFTLNIILSARAASSATAGYCVARNRNGVAGNFV